MTSHLSCVSIIGSEQINAGKCFEDDLTLVVNFFMTEADTYRNQSIDLLGKSMDWFLYDNGLRHERVKQVVKNFDKKAIY